MAQDPVADLLYDEGCPDCGRRLIDLPDMLPEVGDDFDWDQRDYDGFRLFMLQELAARFPERRRWTPADVEVALAEVLAYALDQLSDGLDRAQAERFLETARRPESLRRLLLMVGYDVAGLTKRTQEGPFAKLDADQAAAPLDASDRLRFDDWWLDHPEQMELARLDGPRSIHEQHRMVTLEDFQLQLERHPLVLRAHAWERWDGSWSTVHVAVINWRRLDLDTPCNDFSDDIWSQTQDFHAERGVHLPERADAPNVRSILYPYLESYRMVGQEVVLEEAVEVGIVIGLSLQVNSEYFQSEIRHAVERALGTGTRGIFCARKASVWRRSLCK